MYTGIQGFKVLYWPRGKSLTAMSMPSHQSSGHQVHANQAEVLGKEPIRVSTTSEPD